MVYSTVIAMVFLVWQSLNNPGHVFKVNISGILEKIQMFRVPEDRIPGLTILVQGRNVQFLCACSSWRGAFREDALISSKHSFKMLQICIRGLLLDFSRIFELGNECIIGKLL